MEELMVKKAGKLFFAFGLKSIRLDDIAKESGILTNIINNIQRGIDENFYRSHPDIPFKAYLRVKQYTTALTHNILLDRITSPYKLVHRHTDFYLHSVTNEKGKKFISKYMNMNN